MIADVSAALDLLMSAKYDAGTSNLIIPKERLAGEILQKFINYNGRIAI